MIRKLHLMSRCLLAFFRFVACVLGAEIQLFLDSSSSSHGEPRRAAALYRRCVRCALHALCREVCPAPLWPPVSSQTDSYGVIVILPSPGLATQSCPSCTAVWHHGGRCGACCIVYNMELHCLLQCPEGGFGASHDLQQISDGAEKLHQNYNH